MSIALRIPIILKAETPEALTQKILQLQIQLNGMIKIETILQDNKTNEYICFYYPPGNHGGGIM